MIPFVQSEPSVGTLAARKREMRVAQLLLSRVINADVVTNFDIDDLNLHH